MIKDNKSVRLSVIMPCFNKAEYLIMMVDSIIAQSFADWELIIVDDGSDEENFSRISSYARTDSRIQYIRRDREPKNGNTCRNIGMDMARGEYMIIFDADDLIAEDCFEKRIVFMDNHPECDYASFMVDNFYDGSSDSYPFQFNKSSEGILSNLLSTHYPFTVWANIYRTESVREVRWDEQLYVYQDFDFMVQCDLVGLKHCYSDRETPDYHYRQFVNGSNVCGNFVNERKIASSNYLFGKIFGMIELRTDKERLLKSYRKFVVLQLERLLKTHDSSIVNIFLDIVAPHYPDKHYSFRRLCSYYRQSDTDHLDYAFFHFMVFVNLGDSYRLKAAIVELLKFVHLR